MYKYYKHVDKELEFEANLWMELYCWYINDDLAHADNAFVASGCANLDKEDLRRCNAETLADLLCSFDVDEIINDIPETSEYFSSGEVYAIMFDRTFANINRDLDKALACL